MHMIPPHAWQTTSPVRPPIRCTGGPLLAKLAGISRRLCRESPRDLFVLRAKQRKNRFRDSARPEKNECRTFKKALSKLAMPLAQSRPTLNLHETYLPGYLPFVPSFRDTRVNLKKSPGPHFFHAGVLTKKSVARGKQYVREFVHTVWVCMGF